MTIPESVLDHLVVATEEVFETMVFKPVARCPFLDGDAVRPASNVVATVAFAGHRRGLVAFHSSLDAAREIAGEMLGMPVETLNGEMPDAIGEIANMIAGSAKRNFGAAASISIPSIVMGSGHTLARLHDQPCIVIPCNSEFGRFVIEVSVKANS